MLFVAVSLFSFLRTYISKEKIEKYLGKKSFKNYFIASFFGAITPFCSCSSIPIFVSFIKTQVPIGIAFAFLITSPITNQYLFSMMLGLFGYKISILYVLNGILIGSICGMIFDRMRLEKYILEDIKKSSLTQCRENKEEYFLSITDRLRYGVKESFELIKKLWLWIVISVFIAAVLEAYLPKQKIEAIISKAGFWDVPIAVALGVPIYASCVSILPVAYVLFTKGLPLGTTLSFLMSTSALCLPEAIILRRIMKTKLILIFFGFVSISITITGYLFNFLERLI